MDWIHCSGGVDLQYCQRDCQSLAGTYVSMLLLLLFIVIAVYCYCLLLLLFIVIVYCYSFLYYCTSLIIVIAGFWHSGKTVRWYSWLDLVGMGQQHWRLAVSLVSEISDPFRSL